MRRRDALAIHNERLKLGAATANAVALAILALGSVRPIIDRTVPLTWEALMFGGIALVGHLAAHYILGQLEMDE